MKKIKIKKINKPKKEELDRDITWLCNSLCLSSGRDTEYTSEKIIKNILNKLSKKKKPVSKNIADDLDLTQDLVNYHLRKLIKAGVVVRKKKKITIRGGSLKQAVKEIKRDTKNMLKDIEKIAESIDEKLGIENR